MTRGHGDKGIIIIALICLLAFGFRIYGLNAQSLWYDETFTLYHARQGLMAGVAGLLREDNTLPLYGALLALWIQAAGSGEFAARYFSALVGTLAVPLAFQLGSALSGRRWGGWGAALALATLPIQVYYAQEVRMYALAAPLAAAFAWAAWRLARRGRGAVIFIAAGIAMLLAHLYTGLLWAAILVWGIVFFLHRASQRKHRDTQSLNSLCISAPAPRASRMFLLSNLALGLAALPIAAWALRRAQLDATAASAIPLDVLIWLPVQFGVGQYLPSPWDWLLAGITIFSIAAACVELGRARRGSAALWVLCVIMLPILALLAISIIKAKWDARYLLPSVGLGLTVGAGLGWEMLARRRAWLGAALGLAWLGLTFPAVIQQTRGAALAIIDEWHPRPDFRSAARYIANHDSPGDAIVVVGGYAAHSLAYYYDGPADLFGLPLNVRLVDTQHPLDLRALDSLEQNAGNAQRLWLVLWQTHLADPAGLVQSALLEQCHRLPVSKQFTNVGLLLFDISDCRPLNRLAEPPKRLDIRFAEPVSLLGYDLRARGETWELDLWWEARGTIHADYAVFTHLLGPDGQMIAQHDHIAGSDLYPTHQWTPGTRLRDRFFLPVAGGECKRCTLQVGLYNAAGRLPLASGGEAVTIPLPAP